MNDTSNKVNVTEPQETCLEGLVISLKSIQDKTSNRRVEFETLLMKMTGHGLDDQPKPESIVNNANNSILYVSQNLLDEITTELNFLMQLSKKFSEII